MRFSGHCKNLFIKCQKSCCLQSHLDLLPVYFSVSSDIIGLFSFFKWVNFDKFFWENYSLCLYFQMNKYGVKGFSFLRVGVLKVGKFLRPMHVWINSYFIFILDWWFGRVLNSRFDLDSFSLDFWWYCCVVFWLPVLLLRSLMTFWFPIICMWPFLSSWKVLTVPPYYKIH